jgi:SAM-dependent methyltransferase
VLYGVNRVRSSRQLGTEATRNLEVIWLLCGLRPDFKIIADSVKVEHIAMAVVPARSCNTPRKDETEGGSMGPAMVQLGRFAVSEDWPVKGEAARTFREKLRNGFFSTYMAGEVIIDVGYRGAYEDAVPILPHAVGVDLDFPRYDGTRLPFADASVDTVHSSHMLEHTADYKTTICDWHRVVKPGGFIVCVVPHQFLYEKKRTLPSLWNADHKRFYTPASLLREFEESLEPNTYRIRHLRDNDEHYSYDIGPEAHAAGGYEIELVVQKTERPNWDLAGGEALHTDLAVARNEVSRVAAERDQLARESTRWFDAAIVVAAEQVLRARSTFRWRGSQRLTRWFGAVTLGGRSKGSAIHEAERARHAHQWERASRLYLDALKKDPNDPAVWVQLGHALKEVGKASEAEFAYLHATRLDGPSDR